MEGVDDVLSQYDDVTNLNFVDDPSYDDIPF